MNSLSEEIMTAAVIEKVFLDETKEQTDLKKLIEESIAKRDAKIAASSAATAAEEARYEALFNSIVEDTIEAIKPKVPAPLRQYIKHTHGRPARSLLDAKVWTPTMLVIDAPGLACMVLTTGIDDDGLDAVLKISVGESTSGQFKNDEWPEAIAAAFEYYHKQRAEYSKAARGLDY